MRQFLDVVRQAVQRPLRVDLLSPTQREPIQPFVMPQIAKDRLDSGKAPPITRFAFFTVNRSFHLVTVAFLCPPQPCPERS